MATRPYGNRYLEDPSIAQTAATEYERLWGRIGAKVAMGVPFFRARELVLGEEMMDVGTAYGRVVASRVTAAIERTSPERLPKAATDAVKDSCRRHIEAYLMQTHGKISWYNRLSLALFGVHFA